MLPHEPLKFEYQLQTPTTYNHRMYGAEHCTWLLAECSLENHAMRKKLQKGCDTKQMEMRASTHNYFCFYDVQ